MSFKVIGNMNLYLQSMQMKSVWDMKKKSGDYDAKGATNIQQMLDQIAGKAQDNSRQQDEKLTEILQKVYAGKKLSSDEMEYLRDKAPLVYKELVTIEEEQKAYERELRRCETKEEVERARMNRINGSLTTVNAVSSNPNIPEAAKMALIGQEKRRVDAIVESTEKFVRTGEYAKLPTEAEAAEVHKEQMEELYQQPEQEREWNTEDSDQSEERNMGSGMISSSVDLELERDRVKEEQSDTDDTCIESEEERKVRCAKAKAAYAAFELEDDPERKSKHTLDRKV